MLGRKQMAGQNSSNLVTAKKTPYCHEPEPESESQGVVTGITAL